MGRLARVENERREDPQAEQVSHDPEPSSYREPERRDDDSGADSSREDYAETADAPASFSEEGHSRQDPQAPPSDQPHSIQPAPSGPPQDRGGGGGRGRRGRRLPPRGDRRGPGRNRGGGRGDRGNRGERQPFSSSHHGGSFQQHGHGTHPREAGPDAPRGDAPHRADAPHGSILHEVRAEVERVREILEGVLRDLEDVCEQLTKAEHEKDLAEAEIEQLRDQIRRLHR